MARTGDSNKGNQAAKPDPAAPTRLHEQKTQARAAPGVAETGDWVAPLERGALVDEDYRIVAVLARDANAVSYEAEDVYLNVPVFLKEFAPARYVERQPGGTLAPRQPAQDEGYETARQRFLHEAQTLVRFRHPNIVRAHRVFESHATKFIVLDYEDGETLDDWIANLGRPPSQTELDRLTPPLLSALASIHAAGFLHAGISPSSILVRDGISPVLVNFTGACEMHEPALEPAALRNSQFAAPELRNGDAGRCGPWTDLYALAAVLRLATAGTQPGYRAEFLEAIDKGLAADIAQRPQSVDGWDGIRPPEEPEPAPPPVTASAPTLLRQTRAARSVATAPKTALADIATRVIAALPEAEEESDIPKFDFERWLLPAAIACALLGALLFSTGMNFALAAVFQVAATGLFFLRGYMPLSRYLSHTTRQPDAIARRAEQATRNAAWMIAAILAVMTINPLFVERHITANTALPLATLSAIIVIPALIMAACGYLGMRVRWSLSSLAAGAANAFVVVFNALLFLGFVYTTASTPANAAIHPAVQVNRYLYIIATVAAGILGILIFFSRTAARQRIKQATIGR